MAIMRSALNLCVATSCKLEESLREAPILTPIENLIYIADLDVARVRGKDISRASQLHRVERAKRARVFHNRTSTVYRDLGEGKECSLNPLPQVSWLGRSKDERR